MKIMDKKAFTLIELLVVIAVVGILVLLAAPRFTGYTQRAERIRIQHDVKVMEEEVGTVLINGDDEINEWENNMKDLNQLAQEDELFEKEGIAEEVESIDETYKVIPKEYKGKINTKLKGTFYANSHGKVYYEHGQEPGYSDEEIEDKIKQGFIPVATPEDLNSIRSTEKRIYAAGTKWATKEKVEGGLGLDKKYIQVANIKLSEYSEREEGWEPIGTASKSFMGTYDGGNYVITDLEVKGEGNYQGLFGRAMGATISNVALEEVNVTGGKWVGGLVGMARERMEGTKRIGNKISNSYVTGSVEGTERVGGLAGSSGLSSTISNSYFTGSVTGTGNYVGGLAGEVDGTEISNSYAATDSVKGKDKVGGLAGWTLNNAKISNSYATGSVEGISTVSNATGGLVGHIYSSTEISNSYATGSVKGHRNVGGFVGHADKGPRPEGIKISNSYAIGSVTGGGGNVGGFIGFAQNNITIKNSYATGQITAPRIESSYYAAGGFVGNAYTSVITTNSYWNTETTLWTTSATGEGKSTKDMMKQTTYTDWDFVNVWEITPGNYPTLR